jgi:hypothetical protein
VWQQQGEPHAKHAAVVGPESGADEVSERIRDQAPGSETSHDTG